MTKNWAGETPKHTYKHEQTASLNRVLDMCTCVVVECCFANLGAKDVHAGVLGIL